MSAKAGVAEMLFQSERNNPEECDVERADLSQKAVTFVHDYFKKEILHCMNQSDFN